MNFRDVELKWLLGGSVYYKKHLYAVIGRNKENQTFTIERLSDGNRVKNVTIDQVTEGDN